MGPLDRVGYRFFAITYTSLGGLRAVVIKDLMQTILLYGGALARDRDRNLEDGWL